MGKIVVTEFISLDGIVDDPGGSEAGAPADWTAFDRGVEKAISCRWPSWRRQMCSCSAVSLTRGYAAAWPSIQDEAGFGDILVSGSSQLVHLLAANDLVDQYNLMIFPVLLGSGRKLFPYTRFAVPTRFTAKIVKQVGEVLWVVLERDRSKR